MIACADGPVLPGSRCRAWIRRHIEARSAAMYTIGYNKIGSTAGPAAYAQGTPHAGAPTNATQAAARRKRRNNAARRAFLRALRAA